MTTTTFRVKDSTGWKSTIGFKKLKEAIEYTKTLIDDDDELYKSVDRFYIEVIRIKPLTTGKNKVLVKDIIYYIKASNQWRLSKNNKVVKF